MRRATSASARRGAPAATARTPALSTERWVATAFSARSRTTSGASGVATTATRTSAAATGAGARRSAATAARLRGQDTISMMRRNPGSEKPLRVVGAMKWAWAIGWTIVWATLGILTWPLSPSGRLYLRYARIWSRMAMWGCGIEIVRVGSPQIDWSRPHVFMSSHESIFDIMALFIAIPCDVRMLSKVELRRIPILGWSMWMAGFVFIDRKSPAAAKRSIEAAARIVKGGKSIVIFPEGTRGDGTNLLPFKKGGFLLAIQSGVPVVPIAIRGSAATLPKHTWFPRGGRIEVVIGEPIPTEGLHLDDKNPLAERTREAMAALKSSPATRLAA